MKVFFAATLCFVLASCSISTTSEETKNKRYQTCIEAGGTYWQDGTDWGCDIPNAPSHRPED